jgi:hypothetical protein
VFSRTRTQHFASGKISENPGRREEVLSLFYFGHSVGFGPGTKMDGSAKCSAFGVKLGVAARLLGGRRGQIPATISPTVFANVASRYGNQGLTAQNENRLPH